MSSMSQNFPGKPKRRWLQSVIAAANEEVVMLPWAAKRIERATDSSANFGTVRIFPSGSAAFTAIAAK